MKVSANGINLVISQEGFRSNAYQDATGTWTIGYGHTNDVWQGQVISLDQGKAYLASDLVHVEGAINDQNLKINQNQFDALADLLFNAGTGVLSHFTPLIKVNPNDPAITDKFNEYVYSKGVKLTDLVNRRAKEVALYKKKIQCKQSTMLLSPFGLSWAA
jgi:lysozyme